MVMVFFHPFPECQMGTDAKGRAAGQPGSAISRGRERIERERAGIQPGVGGLRRRSEGWANSAASGRIGGKVTRIVPLSRGLLESIPGVAIRTSDRRHHGGTPRGRAARHFPDCRQGT
jgi:hypothetical protein